MNSEQEKMLVRLQANELCPEERAVPKIERLTCLILPEVLDEFPGLGFARTALVVGRQINQQGGRDQLLELSSIWFESRSQRFVPGNTLI